MLPTRKTPPKSDLSDVTVLIHGPHKFGKSTMCAQSESALFLATEPGLNSLEVYQQPISTWDELLVAAKEIADGKHAFRTIIVDTVDNAYRMCGEYICRKYEVEHESDLDYGKGYAMVNAEFHRVLNKLALLPYGLFLVSHSQEKEIETRTGKYTKVVPTLPDKARKLVLGLVDIILFCDLEPTIGPDSKPAYRRVLRTKPSTAYEAGDRTGRLPEVLDLNFAAFAAAFVQGAPKAAGASVAESAGPALSSPSAAAAPRSADHAPAGNDTDGTRSEHGRQSLAASPGSSKTNTAAPVTSRRPPALDRGAAAAAMSGSARPANSAAATPASSRARTTNSTTPAATKPRAASTANR